MATPPPSSPTGVAASWVTAAGATITLRRSIPAFALALLLYLPVENLLLARLAPIPYWTLRLLPDALIALLALAVVVIGDRRAHTTPVRILWLVTAISLALVGANVLRGIAPSESINAIRVLVRYLVLGLLVWWALDGRPSLGPRIVWAILIGGVIQVAVVPIQILYPLGETSADTSALLFLDGTLGRYDRFGLFMMTVIVALVATTSRLRLWRILLFVACAALLFLSTSRQAIVALGVACAILAVWPRIRRPQRSLALGGGILAVALLLTSPSGARPPTGGDEPDSPGIGTLEPGDLAPVLPLRPIKASTDLSLDPNRNFRLFYNLRVAPWAATVEPLLGFGPRQQVAADTDPRLAAFFEDAGMPWSWARNFTNDSNYATLIIQFGIVATALFLAFLLGSALVVARAEWIRRDETARFAVAFAAATLAAAWFGPAFEIRTVSIVLWVALLAALAAAQREPVDPTVPVAGLADEPRPT